MKSILALFLAVCFTLPAFAAESTSVSVGVGITNGELSSFHLGIATHYKVKESQVVAIKTHKISDDQLPVVFFLAQQTHQSPEAIVKLRLGGMSWMQITRHFGLGPAIFYVPVEKTYGPPYGKALGHFKNRNKAQWHTIQFLDDDIVNLVNLKFLSAHHGCSVDFVIGQHQSNDSWLSLHSRVKLKKPFGKPNAGDPQHHNQKQAMKPKQHHLMEAQQQTTQSGKGNGHQHKAHSGRGGKKGRR